MTTTFLDQRELARRFRVSPRTLERWRSIKSGPNYHKLGGKIVYSVADVEAYERRISRSRQSARRQ